MAHYAFLDDNNIVTEVITGKDENDLQDGVTDWEVWYGNFRGQVCKRTSYNTNNGVHSAGGVPFRKNYATIGSVYDSVRDAFIPPKPFQSWTFNEDKCNWEPPVQHPRDGKNYYWDEQIINWKEVDNGND